MYYYFIFYKLYIYFFTFFIITVIADFFFCNTLMRFLGENLKHQHNPTISYFFYFFILE